MKTGAEPKKIAILAVLLLVAGVALYENVFRGDSDAPASARAPKAQPIAAAAPARPTATPAARRQLSVNTGEFKPRQGYERPEDRPDPATIDPTLRLDLLAKVQNVEPESALRNIFQYGAASPPPKPLPTDVPKIAINNKPPAAPPAPPGPPPAPAAPPITFKYYGYRISKSNGHKEAFLLDGDDIIVAPENASLKNARYKVVNIGLTSITIEDTQFKSTQTLHLEEDKAG